MINEQILNAVVARLKAYATDHYNTGWDPVVECFETQDYIDEIYKIGTADNVNNEDELYTAALAQLKIFVDIYAEQLSNTRFE